MKTDNQKLLLIEQIKLQNEIVTKLGINIVTCCDCGTVVLHKTEVEEIKCFDCGCESESCDFPDLFYQGMENYFKPIQ